MINIEQLWRDYSKYEEVRAVSTVSSLLGHAPDTRPLHQQGINVHLAKKMIEDRSRDYMNARRVAKVWHPQVY